MYWQNTYQTLHFVLSSVFPTVPSAIETKYLLYIEDFPANILSYPRQKPSLSRDYVCYGVVIVSLWRYAVAQLVEALRYKPEDCGFDSRLCQRNFSLTFLPHYGLEVDSASNRNGYQEYFLGVKVADA
jgi:hypothetical protein